MESGARTSITMTTTMTVANAVAGASASTGAGKVVTGFHVTTFDVDGIGYCWLQCRCDLLEGVS